MKAYIIFWTVIIYFSLVSFTIMSYIMLVKGIPELRDMFKQLGEKDTGSEGG
jgi:hypothetical protein